MFSERLERLIEAALEDGQLTQQEIDAIKKRAEAEGEDLNEVEIYIQSLMQKRQQKAQKEAADAAREEMVARKKAQEAQDKADEENEKARRGNVCPHCGTPIPPLTKICPECGKAVSGNETAGDKNIEKTMDILLKMHALIGSQKNAGRLWHLDDYFIKKWNTGISMIERAEAIEKINSEVLKAETYYGANPQIKNLVDKINASLNEGSNKTSNKKVAPQIKVPKVAIVAIILIVIGAVCYFAFGGSYISSHRSNNIEMSSDFEETQKEAIENAQKEAIEQMQKALDN